MQPLKHVLVPCTCCFNGVLVADSFFFSIIALRLVAPLSSFIHDVLALEYVMAIMVGFRRGHVGTSIGPDCGRAPCIPSGIRQQGSHLVGLHVRAVLCCCGRNDGVICSH